MNVTLYMIEVGEWHIARLNDAGVAVEFLDASGRLTNHPGLQKTFRTGEEAAAYATKKGWTVKNTETFEQHGSEAYYNR